MMKQQMKTRVVTSILSAAAVWGLAGPAAAQTQNNRSAYFLGGATFRHELNPAFMGERGYVTMPGLGNLAFGAQGTSGVGDFLFVKQNGDLMTFMHEDVGRDEFLNGLPRRVKFGFNLEETILSTGFYAWGGFNTFGISVKSNTDFSAPDALFKFMKSGVDRPEGTHYQIDDISAVSTNYAEIALGHARELNEQWTVGAKVKFLVGLAKATVKIDRLDVVATPDYWQITPSGAQAYLSAKGLVAPTRGETGNYDGSDYALDDTGNRTDQLKPGSENLLSYDDLDFDDNNIGPTGFGMAFDFGATYRLNDEWTFSAAVLDLGFIRWKNTVKATMNNSFEFDGFTEIPVNSDLGDDDPNSIDNQADRIGDDLEELSKFTKEGEGLKRATALAATLNLGAQYTLPAYDRLNFGLLSSTRFQGRHWWTEARVSANVSPLKWFEASLNYAISNFGSTGGLMLNFHPRGFNFFIAADAPMGKFSPKYYAPVNRFALNVNLGINFTFGPEYKRKYNCVEVQSL